MVNEEKLGRLLSVSPLNSWTEKTYHTQAAKTGAAALRQGIADSDWDTDERHGSLDAVVEKNHQTGEETVASAGTA